MIKVTEDYYVKPEDNTYMVMKRRYNSKKEEYEFNVLTFHGSLTEAVDRILKFEQCNRLADKDVSLHEAVAILKGIKEDVRRELLANISINEKLQ